MLGLPAKIARLGALRFWQSAATSTQLEEQAGLANESCNPQASRTALKCEPPLLDSRSDSSLQGFNEQLM